MGHHYERRDILKVHSCDASKRGGHCSCGFRRDCDHEKTRVTHAHVGDEFNSTRSCTASVTESETVAVRLTDVVPLLVHAMQTNRGWLSDFADDTVHIPQDLYDVLLAYQDLVVRRAA